MFKLINNSIIFLVIMALISGCYTFNKSHNLAHDRVIKKDLELLHNDVDSFLGLDKPSLLSDERNIEVITDS